MKSFAPHQTHHSRNQGNAALATVVLAIVLLVVGAAAFAHFYAKAKVSSCASPAQNCIHNLRIIDGATGQWAIDHQKGTNDVPQWDDILPYAGGKLVCPMGGKYTLGSLANAPTCSIPGHILP